MLIINKDGFAEIILENQTIPIIKPGFRETTISAKFTDFKNNHIDIEPIWIVECSDKNKFVFSISDDEKSLSISTKYTISDSIIVTLCDRLKKYEPCRMVFKVEKL